MDKKTEDLLRLAHDCDDNCDTRAVGEAILAILRGEGYNGL